MACVLFNLQNGLLDALDVAHFVDAQLLEIATLQGEQLRAADVVTDKIFTVLLELERFQPGGHFVVAPMVNVEAQVDARVGVSGVSSADAALRRSHVRVTMALSAGRTGSGFGTAEFQTE